ncbi:hypothetical protein MTO96_018213 [Rhipicephalus appendiculatus]
MQVGGVLAAPRDVRVEKPTNVDDSNNDYVYSEAVLLEDTPGEVAESTGAKTPKSALSRTSSEVEEQMEDERPGGLLSPFQKRWCAVRDGYLFLYEKPTDKRQ